MIERTDCPGVWRLTTQKLGSSAGPDLIGETALLRRRPASVLPVSWLAGDQGTLLFRPESRGLTPLRQAINRLDKKPATGRRLLGAIMEAVDEAADHLFDLEGMLLNPDLIFTAGPDVRIVCLPLAGMAGDRSRMDLLDWLADSFQWEPDWTASLTLFYGEQANWGRLPDTGQDKVGANPGRPAGERTKGADPGPPQRFSPLSRLRDLFLGREAYESIHEETEDLDLSQRQMRIAQLSEGLPGTPEEDQGRRAYILTEEFIIGRDIRDADLCIDSSAISRQHARITLKGGNFFLEDLGSRNGTRLDGVRLNRKKEYRLPDKCRLAFAQEHFYFRSE